MRIYHCALVIWPFLGRPGQVVADPPQEPPKAPVANTFPVTFDLPETGFVTLVAEDAQGNRAANLLSDAYLPARHHQVTWDALDVGEKAMVDNKPEVVRHRIQPGTTIYGDWFITGFI